jgi:hypothetical protein
MFVRYFVEIPAPYIDVEAALLDAPERWIPGLARAAGNRGEQLLTDAGFGSAEHRLEREVEISIRKPMRFPSRTVLPMSWTPTSSERLLPTLDVDLEVAPLGPNRTQLAISAHYRPPFGAVGRAPDRALMRRVAEATVKDFLDRVAAQLP